jgi:hypothetical protein
MGEENGEDSHANNLSGVGMYAIWLPKAEAKRELARRLAEAIAEDARCRDEMAARRKTP